MIEGVIKDNGRDNLMSIHKTGPKPVEKMTIDSKIISGGVF